MDKLVVSDLVSALEDGEMNTPSLLVRSNSNKVNPLRTNKQRNISNNHRKSKLTAAGACGGQSKPSADNNSTDDEGEVRQHLGSTAGSGGGSLNADEEGHELWNCDTIEDQSYVDSDENITERLCHLSKLSLHGDSSSVGGACGGGGPSTSTGGVTGGGASGGSKTVSKKHTAYYPSLLVESDSFNEVHPNKYQQPLASSSCCPAPGGGRTGGDCASGGPGGSTRRCRRRRRRRGLSTKRMAVDASSNNNNEGEASLIGPHPTDINIRPIRPDGIYEHSDRYYRKTKSSDKKLQEPLLLDSYGMKRKRNFGGCHSKLSGSGGAWPVEMGESLSALSCSAAVHMDDEEMRSGDEDDYSTSSDDKEEDDAGREADDEQSDWVSDEWNTSTNSSSSQEETAQSRKNRMLTLLQYYNKMISNGIPVGPQAPLRNPRTDDQYVYREILAGKRRVLTSKPVFTTRSICTSANEVVSKFLQDPLQSQLRLQPVSPEEQVQLNNLATLYSLRMDYCTNSVDTPPRETMAPPDVIPGDPDLKLCPVLTKTPKTTQMDPHNNPVADLPLSPGECTPSGPSLTSAVPYSPALSYSDIDSKTNDSKRMKK